jgi:hypothetical protein
MFRGIDLPLIYFTSAFTNLPLLTPMAKLAIEVIVSSLRRSTNATCGTRSTAEGRRPSLK